MLEELQFMGNLFKIISGSKHIINLGWMTSCGRDSRLEQGQRMIMKERHR